MNGATGSSFGRAIRLMVGVIGGYLFTNGFIAIVGAGLPHLGVPQSEALFLAIILGFMIYLLVMFWVIVTRHLSLVSSSILGFAALMLITAPHLVHG